MYPAEAWPPRRLRLPLHWWEEHDRLWLRLLIIGGALGGSTCLAWRWALAGPQAALREMGLLIATGAVLAFLRWPLLGLVALVAGALTVPAAIGTGTETRLNAAVLLVGLVCTAWLLQMVRQRNLRLMASPPIAALLTLLVVALLAFIAGSHPWLPFARTASLPAQLGGLAIFLLSAGAFLLAAHLVRDMRHLQWLTWVFLAVAAVHVAARLVPGGAEITRLLLGRDSLGSLFWTWLAALAFSQAAFNRALGLPWRLALAGLVAATFYVALGQSKDWLSGWVPPLIAVAATLVIGAPRLGPFVVITAALVAAANYPHVAALVMGSDNEYSMSTRLEAWRIMAQIIAINPILGLGFANYYWYTPLFPILGYAVSFNSHNNYIDIAAQTGLLGLGCFLWFVLALGRLGWHVRTRVPRGFAQAYVYGALGGLAGTLVAAGLGDWVLPFVYNIGFSGFRSSVLGWVFLGGLVALEQVVARERSMEKA